MLSSGIVILLELFSQRSNHILHSLHKGSSIKNRFRYSAPRSWSNIKNAVVLTILTFQHIQCLHLMYVEVAWVLVSLGTQVRPKIILDPDCLPDCLFDSDDYEITMITWSLLHFKIFKIQFCGVPFLHYILFCKIHISMQKMTLSNLLKYISFFSIKLANFLYMTCSICYLIPIWAQSHRLYF